MGLSAMQDAPGADQAMRFANIAGQMQYVAPSAWLGENGLDGLGLGDGSPVTPDTVNAISGGIANIIGAIGQLKGAKKNKNNPAPALAPASMIHQDIPSDGGGSGMGKILLIGGAVVLAGVVIYMVMKKKKNGAHAGE